MYLGSGTTGGRSAFLFVGTNSSIYNSSGFNGALSGSGLDLSDLPTTYNATGFGFNGTAKPLPLLATILICNPRLTYSSANVILYTNGTLAVQNSNEQPVLGNIPAAQAMVITSNSLSNGIGTMDLLNEEPLISTISSALFLNSTSNNVGQTVLPIDYINDNMDRFIASAAKAYANGYLDPNDTVTVDVPATIQATRLALLTSKPLWIIFIVLFGLEFTALVAAFHLGATSTNLFNLENVARASLELAGRNELWRYEILGSSRLLGNGEEKTELTGETTPNRVSEEINSSAQARESATARDSIL